MTTQTLMWNQYKQFVSDLVQKRVSFYCRGQSNDKWPLQTSFHRMATGTGITLLQYLDTILPELQYYICAVQNEIIDLQNQYEFGAFLALVQHHGFPTPLLDWTFSPYIAAYFAYKDVDEKNPQSEKVRIFLFDHVEWTKTYQQPLNLRDTSTNYVSILRPYAKYNPRVIPQQGVFTVTNVADMEDYILSCQNKSKKEFIWVSDLPVKEKPTVMRELSLMGITEMTMFPSIEGICRSVKAQFFSLDKVGPTPTERLAALAAQLRQTQQVPNPVIGKPPA